MVIQKDDDGKVKIKGIVHDHLNSLVQAIGNAKYETTFTIIIDWLLFLDLYLIFVIRIEYSYFNRSHIRKCPRTNQQCKNSIEIRCFTVN